MRPLVARVVAAGLLMAAATVGIVGGPAGAEKPDQSAYWVRTQNSQLPGQPPNPEVPPGDLSVVNDPSAAATTPTAYAAVRLTAPDTIAATLLLKLADVSTAQTIAVSACTVDAPWQPTTDGGPGPYDKAPTYVVSSCVNGIATSDGTGFTFALTPAQQTAPGTYDVAIVPTPTTPPTPPPAPFSATFAQPDQSSFTLFEGTSSEQAPDGSASPVSPVAAPGSDFSSVPAESTNAGSTFTPAPFVPPDASATPPAAASPVAPAAVAPQRPAVPAVAIPKAPDKAWQRFMAIGLLLAMAAAMWFVVGQPAHSPRLLGALAGRRSASASADGSGGEAVSIGGIGRFAKPRSGKPRRLF